MVFYFTWGGLGPARAHYAGALQFAPCAVRALAATATLPSVTPGRFSPLLTAELPRNHYKAPHVRATTTDLVFFCIFLVWALVGFGGFLWALVGFVGFYRIWWALSGLSGFIGFYRVLSGFIGFCAAVSSTPGARAGGCRNQRTKTHAHETTHSTRAVGSHDVATVGSLVASRPCVSRSPQFTSSWNTAVRRTSRARARRRRRRLQWWCVAAA